MTDISLHPTGEYLLTSSTDEVLSIVICISLFYSIFSQYWAFSDIGSGHVLTKANEPDSSSRKRLI